MMSSGPPEDVSFKLSRSFAIPAVERLTDSIDSHNNVGNIGTSASSTVNKDEK